MKSIIKLLGLSIGCSCTSIQAQQNVKQNLDSRDAIVLTAVTSDDSAIKTTSLSSLQDIGKLYAL